MRYYFLKPIRPAQSAGTPVLSVSPVSLTLDRTAPGNVATFTASLNLDSGSAVAVTVSSSDPSVTVSPAAFPLGGGNPVARTVTVTGATAGPDAVSLTVSAPGQTTRFIGISRPPVPLDLTVTPASLVLDRVSPGNVGTFTAALNRVPESSVSVSVSSSDPSVTVSPASFSLITGNPPSQTITLTGNATGPSPVTISVNPVSLTAKTVAVTRTAFTPAVIPSLALWLDANDTASLTLDGSSAVSQWSDKSGGARHLTQASAAFRPAYVTNALNGKPVVRSDGVDDVLQSAPQPATVWYGSGTQQITYMYLIAYRSYRTGNNLSLMLNTGLFNNTNRVIVDRVTPGDGSSDFVISAGGNTQFITSAPQAGTAWIITTIRWTNGGTPTLRRTTTASTATYSGLGTLTGTMADNQFAAVGSGTNLPTNFDLAEHMIYNRALSDAEVAQIETYLLGKWGTI